MRLKHTSPDWKTMLEQIEGTGRTLSEISACLGFASSHRVLLHYKNGVQPLYHRGEPLIMLWCELLHKQRADVPHIPVRMPYRVPYSVRQNSMDAGAIALPVFPAEAVQPLRGRKKREAA